MTWQVQAGGRLGALGALVTLYLSLLLAAGQAPYDWAWSRGQHATPAQWRAHERADQTEGGHHSVTAAKRAAPGAWSGVLPRAGGGQLIEDAQDGLWIEEGTHDLHPAVADGYTADRVPSLAIAPPAVWRPVALPWIGAAPGTPPLPGLQPPRPTGGR